MSFEISLPAFEGPFDLLLFFIERDELDIHDIPISKLTRDFLAYLHLQQQLNLEVASEFIWVASTLMRIKAKMLLPRKAIDESGFEIDPRAELVQHLLEYKKYKSVVADFALMETKRSQLFERGNITQELASIAGTQSADWELETLDLYKLHTTFRKVLAQFDRETNTPKHTVVQYPYSIDGQKVVLLTMLQVAGGMVSFEDVLTAATNRIEIVFSLLAVLDMLQTNDIFLQERLGFNAFWVGLKPFVNDLQSGVTL